MSAMTRHLCGADAVRCGMLSRTFSPRAPLGHAQKCRNTRWKAAARTRTATWRRASRLRGRTPRAPSGSPRPAGPPPHHSAIISRLFQCPRPWARSDFPGLACHFPDCRCCRISRTSASRQLSEMAHLAGLSIFSERVQQQLLSQSSGTCFFTPPSFFPGAAAASGDARLRHARRAARAAPLRALRRLAPGAARAPECAYPAARLGSKPRPAPAPMPESIARSRRTGAGSVLVVGYRAPRCSSPHAFHHCIVLLSPLLLPARGPLVVLRSSLQHMRSVRPVRGQSAVSPRPVRSQSTLSPQPKDNATRRGRPPHGPSCRWGAASVWRRAPPRTSPAPLQACTPHISQTSHTLSNLFPGIYVCCALLAGALGAFYPPQTPTPTPGPDPSGQPRPA